VLIEKSPEYTTDTLLGGKVTILQPKDGYRVAIDPVLLAASIQPRPGDRVLDVGAGTGAVSLCLAHRLPGLDITGLEVDETYWSLARRSAALNDCQIDFQQGDLFSLPSLLRGQAFQYVVSNPPFRSPESNRRASPGRRGAHFLDGVTLQGWISACLRTLAPKGVLSLIIPADKLDEAIASLAGRAGNIGLYPLWSKAGATAKRVILQATGQSKAPARMAPGLVLHAPDDTYTPEAQKVFHDGCALRNL
jgi:tRNA1(Val) A37 N6-methylase TrmN6